MNMENKVSEFIFELDLPGGVFPTRGLAGHCRGLDLVRPWQAPSRVRLVKASQGDFDFVNTYLIDLWHGSFDLLSILIF